MGRQDDASLYVVTCGLCGETWLLTSAAEDQVEECLFCGMRGCLHLGRAHADEAGQQKIEARLRPVGH